MENPNTGNLTVSIHATASEVWAALTKPELIKQYFFGTEAVSDWTEGSPISFKGEWEGRPYEDKGTILIIEPPKILRFNYWSALSPLEDKPANYLTITYELFEEGGDTTLTITQQNFPDEDSRDATMQNWRKAMTDLKNLLENPPEEKILEAPAP